MKNHKVSKTITLSSLVLASTCWSSIALAQASAADETEYSSGNDIIVTATKRGNSTIIDTPITIQAIGEDALNGRGATEFADFSKLVAGLSTWDQGTGNKRYVLRGVSSGGAGTVGVYLDEIVLTGENAQSGGGLQADPRLYDVQRIEVLKGPQGTTFGSSALSGVIRYIVNKPNLTEIGTKGRVAVTQQKGAGVGTNFDATANIPIIDGVAAIRASGFYQYRPGYIDNKWTDGANSEKTWSGRVQGRVKVGPATLDLFYQHQDTDAGLDYYNLTTETRGPVPTKYYQSAVERVFFKDKMDLFNATLNYDTGIGTITAVATNTKRTLAYGRPATAVLAAAARLPVTNLNVQSTLSNPRTNKTQAYELRFASDWGGPIGLLAGVYYQKDDRVFASQIPVINPDTGYIGGTGSFGPILQNRSLTTQIKEKAVFAEVTFDITDKLQVIGGARAFQFNNMSQGLVTTGVLGRPGTGLGPITRDKAKDVIFRGIASYNFTPRTKLYAQVAQGYRPGGTNDQAAAALGGTTVPDGFTSDSLVNYEVGFKHASIDNRLLFTVAGFYIDWSDIQLALRTPVGPTGTQYAYTGNAGKARIYGAEMELQVEPVRGLRLGFSGAYINPTVREAVPGAGVEGDSIPYSPKITATLSGDYEFAVGDHKAFIGGDAAYTDDRVSDFPTNTTNYFELKNFVVVNARAGVDFGRFNVTLNVKNLLDDKTVTDVFLQQPPTTLTGYFRVPPRTVSLQFGVDF